ncbi:hypothetical protein AB0C77_19605 [Streptomyces sp. NPDC048629]|uniref:hypothetical protein n=1 Tax=Streptomyces sp. NPDC048629 TaxID=3154824 RepID=UPI00342A218D
MAVPLLAGLVLGVLLPVGSGPDAVAGGVGAGALRMTVTVNGRGGTAAAPPAVRVGGLVVKRYRLVNRGEADLYRIRVVDPSVPGSVTCPVRTLAALASVECSVRFAARPGRYAAAATASGDVPSLRRTLTATSRSGYEGVGGVLVLTETVRTVPPHSLPSAVVGYTVANRGNRPVHGVRLTDRALAPGRIDCAGRPGGVPVLPPGGSVRCTATVHRPPGVHRSTGEASGSDRVATLGAGGGPVAPPLLVARATARFTLRGAATAPAAVARPPQPPAGARPTPARTAARTPAPSASAAQSAAPAPAAAADASVPPASDAAALPLLVAPGPGAAEGVGPVAPGAAAPGTAAPGAAAGADGVGAEGAGAGAAAAPPVVPPPGAAPPAGIGANAAQPPADRPALADVPTARPPTDDSDDDGLLARVQRRSRELADMSVALTLLLILIPAAVAAALLGSRRP